MYIKQVIIEGFKSYKEQVATEPFSPKHNCVVGANGSGKTNFFHAIRFVLSDLFHNLRAEDRQALLHEGAGHQVFSAYVEIVFDNSDNRIPVDKGEVHLRRTIGLKKDEYFLDRKHITKTEVMNLLESAGFSRSNPYYVVQQGKIASLTLMKDSERLDLLKEIGGTRVYEERRKESLKIMQETESKRKQIIEVVQYIEERLKELDEEKEELRKYQQLDKQRRSLEYTIFEKEVEDAKQKLEEVEEARKNVSEKSTTMYNSVLEAHERLKNLEKDLKNVSKESQALLKEKDSAEKRKTEVMEKLAKVELDVKDLQERIKGEARLKEDIVMELRILGKEITKSRKELEKVRPLHEQQLIEEEEITKGIIEREKRLSLLYQKQGRATQFSSKADRDKWLQKEIDDVERVLSRAKAQEEKLNDEIQQLNEELSAQERNIKSRSEEMQDLESHIATCQKEFSLLKVQRDELQETRKKQWKQENELTSEIDKLKSEIIKAEKNLDHATPGDIRRGLNSVRKLCREYGYSGICGPICELLECDEKFFTAAEVTAGNSLFHIVAESDEESSKIIKVLSTQKGGRVTFIPLNQVKAPEVTYPQNRDVVPLLKKLRFSPKYAPAFAQIFARTVICRDLDVATKVARSNDLDCITLEGDQVSKKGGMTGGFYDHRRSKLKLMNIIRQNTIAINSKQEELAKVKASILEIDQKITTIGSEQQKMDAKRGHLKSQLEQIQQDIANATQQQLSISSALGKKKKLAANAHNQVEQLKAGIAMKRAEMGTDLIDQLTAEEKALLSRLNPEITQLREKLLLCKRTRTETETKKSELETNLSTNLVRRQQELETQLASADSETLSADLELKIQEQRDVMAQVEEASQELKEITDKIEKYTKQIRDMKNAMDELKALEDTYERTLQDEAKDLEQLLNKRNLLHAKREDYMKKIRDLGSLPSDAFDKYKRKNLKELHKMLHKCTEQLKKFSHVNKKALEQYVNFTEQREELQKRQEELNAGDEKIRELISVLDQRKDESIERTFKGVAKNFREAFAELVPGGYGSLVMMKKKKAGDEDDEDPDDYGNRDAESDGRVEKYIGVKVKVSFTGQGETQSMKQLSGGQKTVVALSLIFAIQRCDPAPFYLFDEIDAALDPQYRTAVGNMIKRQADTANTQFITTTFRPELVKVADKIYGVTHKNRVSRVDVITKEDALRFIEHDQSHQGIS